MAYNNYFPATYNYQPQQTNFQPQQNNGIIWVQGENAARSFMVGAGQSVLLMDSDASCFYIKSADASGMPMPLRIFDYTERVVNTMPVVEKPENGANMSPEQYVTREEFDEAIKNLETSLKKKGKKDE